LNVGQKKTSCRRTTAQAIKGVIMRHIASLAVVVLAFVAFTAKAEDKAAALVGVWEGKDAKSGKAVSLEFKADKTAVMKEDGQDGTPPGGSVMWELKDADKGHLDLVIKAGEQEIRLECLIELSGDKLKLGGPKGEKRAATMAEAEDPTELTRKK
jgi:hypothetical protein